MIDHEKGDGNERAIYVAWQEHVGVPIQEGNGLGVAQEIMGNVCRVAWRGKRYGGKQMKNAKATGVGMHEAGAAIATMNLAREKVIAVWENPATTQVEAKEADAALIAAKALWEKSDKARWRK